MSVKLFEPHFAAPGGFFSFVFQALQSHAGAEGTDAPRPLPKMTEPREHESAWVDVDGCLLLIDMSDHVFLLDLPALRKCDLYFKTNFHRATAAAVLAESGEEALLSKIRPFFSFAGYLADYVKPSFLRDLYDRFRGRSEDVCDVVGVYEHLRREGEPSVFMPQGPELTPNRVHYWARVHTLEALKKEGLTGTLRLTSRYQKELEDGELICPNLSQRAYRRAILRSKMLVINTLPHALLPWKATESLALGRPFIVDIPPLTEFPEPFRLSEGVHYLSMLPPASFSSATEGRVLHDYRVEDFQGGAERVASILRDPEQLGEMEEQVRIFRDRALHPQTIVDYILSEVEALA
ncbi:hypothetical protein P3T73_16075 [Kiritimatiellota bacterium B12222]|nr:hypothetical protein P3T73_16075 [Kiritimatiellota bacterium B12222]